jgi:tetratricopeptide (TPR) repeat protein
MPANAFNKALRPIHAALLIIIILVVGIIVYSNTFHAEMVFDDHHFIINDPAIRMTDLSWNSIKTAALEGSPRHRYLPNISWALNYYFGQLNPFGYHLVNLIIHLLSGIFLFFFIKNTLRVYPNDSQNIHPELLASFAALIWIVQPVGTQSVTYICQRMASMVALFYILSLFFYVQARLTMRKNSGKKLVPGLFLLGCALSALCAIATKENAGTLPIVILLYEWFFFQDLKLNWSRRQILWIGFFVMTFAGLVFWYLGENPVSRIIASYSYNNRNFNLPQRIMTEWRIMVYYISIFLWVPPGRLNLDHDYPLSLSPIDPPTTMLALSAILGLLALAANSAKKDRLIAFCILWFFITQATESTIIGIELIFEHRTYIPFMMTSLLFVLIIFRMIRNKTFAYALLAAIALVFSVWTYQRNQIWQDPVTFWTDAMAKSADKPRAVKNLAFAYQQKEEWAAAVFYYKKAIDMDEKTDSPEFSILANLGAALVKQNRFFDAVYYYSKAIERKDAASNILQPMAFALHRIGELEAAKMYYQMAIGFFPEDELATKGLAALTVFLNQHTNPNDQIRQLLTEKPNDAALLLKKGDLLNQNKLADQAIAAYQKALTFTDDNDEMLRRVILSRLAKAYFLTRRFEDSLAAYRRLIAMTPDNAMLYYNTAAVYAVQGKISKAKAFLKKAADKGLNVGERIKTDPNFEKVK